MKKTLLTLIILSSLVSCKKEPIKVDSHGEFKVELLFIHDGCKVYRFFDNSSYVYWSDCSGRIKREVTHSNGKSSHTETHQTLNN